MVAIIIYYQLGGAEPVQLRIVERQQMYVFGQHFEGFPNDKKLEEIFFAARDRAIAEKLDLMVINYPIKEQENKVKQFVGVVRPGRAAGSEEGLDVVPLPQGVYVEAQVRAHNFVMPQPEEVKEQAAKFAQEKKLELETGISYEIYKSDRELVILFYSI